MNIHHTLNQYLMTIALVMFILILMPIVLGGAIGALKLSSVLIHAVTHIAGAM